MKRALLSIGLLFTSNLFMTTAWYWHLKHSGWTLFMAIAISWLIALPEYCLGSSRVDLQACKLEYSIVSPK